MLGVRLGADGAHAADLAGVDRWEQVLPLGAWLPDVEVGPDDDATNLYTSGTTERPKGAVSTHRAVTQALMGYACRGAVDRLRRPQPADDGANGGRPAPAFILSYWNRPEATAETIVDGWLRTGDIGRLDAEGLSTSRTGPRTWCCGAARTCTRPRSWPPSTSTRPCTRPPCSACPTSGWARRSPPSSCRGPARP